VEAYGGTVINFNTTLTIKQEGEPDLVHDANWATYPFKAPPYYALRLALVQTGYNLELQFVHHKLILDNPTDEVPWFEISHGFNTLTLNYAWTGFPVDLRVGGGIVLAHTESDVRGKRFTESDGGYRVTGPVVMGGIGKKLFLSKGFFLGGDVQFIAGRANVPVADGSARTAAIGFHFLFGLGIQL
jgi:hypothetical protein